MALVRDNIAGKDGGGTTVPGALSYDTLPDGSKAALIIIADGATGNEITSLPGVAQDGTDATGVTAPSGATGIRGWLSGIYSRLSSALTVTWSGSPNVTVANASVAVTGTFYQATQPASVSDGSSVTLGAKADTAATNATSAWSAIALLKWAGASLATIATTLSGYLSVNLGIGGATVSSSNAVPIYDAYAAPAVTTWNSTTATGTVNAVPTSGMDSVLVSLVVSGTITAGHVTFEAYDGAAWLPIKGFPLETYYSYQGYVLATGLNNGLQFDIAGCPQFRVRLDTAITGSGSLKLTLNVSSAPLVPGLVAGLDPAAANPVTLQGGANIIGFAGSLNFQTAPVTPTIQAAAYASGNVIGGVQNVSVFRTTGQPSATLSQFLLGALGGESVAVTVYLFSRNPTNGTYTDKTAMTLASADAKYLACAPFVLTPAAAAGTTESFAAQSLELSVQNLDATVTKNLYVVLVAGAAFTPAVGDLWFSISGVQD